MLRPLKPNRSQCYADPDALFFSNSGALKGVRTLTFKMFRAMDMLVLNFFLLLQ